MRLGYSLALAGPQGSERRGGGSDDIPWTYSRGLTRLVMIPIPCLIFGIAEDTPLHPESPFAIAPSAIRALFRLEIAQVLKDEDRGPLLSGELDNASAHQMGNLLIHVADLAPEVGIVLFVLCDDASLGSVACNAS